jgi:hypothetical protein
VPPGVDTVISTTPTEPVGLVAVIWLSLFTVNTVADVLPNFAAVAPVRFVPVMVTCVPPETVPFVGVMLVIDGGGTIYVYAFDNVIVPP